jgi:hypothetical protein
MRAKEIVTVDLNRRLDFGILKKSLVWMSENRNDIWGYYDSFADKAVFDETIDLIDRLKGTPEKLISEANIQYLAPADAADTGLPDSSID